MKRLIRLATELDSMEVADVFNDVFRNADKILKDGLGLNDDFKSNVKMYSKFNNCNLNTFFELIAGSPLANEISNSISDDFNNIVKFVKDDAICKNACENWLKDLMKKIHDTPSLTEAYQGFGNGMQEVKSAKELKDIDDSIGDNTKLKNFIDYHERDKGWLIIYPDQYLETKNGESHTQCLHRWCESKGIDFTSEKSTERLNDEELKKINIDKVSFGHIVSNMAFIENTNQGISVNESVEILKQQNFIKIYEYDSKEHVVERLV